jgi:hypothetical protein
MATPQLSPGVLIREVDLTVGRADNVLDNIGAIAGPFAIGPVDEPVDITTEQELINVFGKPQNKDGQYEYWMSASSFLSYGGVLKVVRTDGENLVNANAIRNDSGISTVGEPSLKIKNFQDYQSNYADDLANYIFTAKHPGSWANDLKVCVIDDKADQIISGVELGLIKIFNNDGAISVVGTSTAIGANTVSVASTGGLKAGQYLNTTNGIFDRETKVIGIAGSVITLSEPTIGSGTTTFQFGDIEDEAYTQEVQTFVNRISNVPVFGLDTENERITGISTSLLVGAGSTIKVGDVVTSNTPLVIGSETTVVGLGTTVVDGVVTGYIDLSKDPLRSISATSLNFGSIVNTTELKSMVGLSAITPLVNIASAGVGQTSVFNGYLKSIITGTVGDDQIEVKITSIVDENGVETPIEYAQNSQLRSFRPGDTLDIIDDAGEPISFVQYKIPTSSSSVKDWYDEQVISLTNISIYWKSIAPKPKTSAYCADRNARNDEMHIVLIDDTGNVTGIQGSILEKHIGLSKAVDAISAVNSPQKIWWKDYLAYYSNLVYAGDNPSDNLIPTELTVNTGFREGYEPFNGDWNVPAQDMIFDALGNVVYNLSGGKDYGENKGMIATLGDLITSYTLFLNRDDVALDYLIMGPGLGNKFESQAKAGYLISLANQRKDCVAVISPHRADVVDLTNADRQTDNIIEFFSPLPSSSYAVFDSGYKYTYDRFNNKFRYIPCNADVAGLMVRTSIFAYPWFSPAGQQRGILNNAIKLAYNPNKAQRDQLYPQRVNAIINKPGIGILLFGDKTALGYASAFDRINVRRLFLTVEQALERTAEAQLFELNDQITRANFVNAVEPYLRQVMAQRGVYGFFVRCDETNNTPDVIDNNEFRADIFLKPAKSINYVTLTFVATRTGVAFEEVAGSV